MKRLIDADLYSRPWFIRLEPRLKCLWLWLLTQCDIAGVAALDWKDISRHIGAEVTADDLPAMEDNIAMLADGRVYLPGFIAFHYGDLHASKKAGVEVLKVLDKHGIPYPVDISKPPFAGATVDDGPSSPVVASEDADGSTAVDVPKKDVPGQLMLLNLPPVPKKVLAVKQPPKQGPRTALAGVAACDVKKPYGEFGNVMLTDAEFAKVEAAQGHGRTLLGIEILGDYIRQPRNARRYADHYAVLKATSWVWRNVDEAKVKLPPSKPVVGGDVRARFF